MAGALEMGEAALTGRGASAVLKKNITPVHRPAGPLTHFPHRWKDRDWHTLDLTTLQRRIVGATL